MLYILNRCFVFLKNKWFGSLSSRRLLYEYTSLICEDRAAVTDDREASSSYTLAGCHVPGSFHACDYSLHSHERLHCYPIGPKGSTPLPYHACQLSSDVPRCELSQPGRSPAVARLVSSWHAC